MTISITEKYFQATSIARFNEIVCNLNKDNENFADIQNDLGLSEITVKTYLSFGQDLDYVTIGDNKTVKLTDKGNIFVNSSIEDKAKMLRNDILNIDDVIEYNRIGESLFAEYKRELFDSEKSASRVVDTARSLSKSSKSISTMILAINGELHATGNTNIHKNQSIIVKTWNCECGMVNAPAVQECDMCGEEKPELENAA